MFTPKITLACYVIIIAETIAISILLGLIIVNLLGF